MEKYNSVLKFDSNGVLYQRVIFNMPIIKKGFKTNSKPTKIHFDENSKEENLKRAQRRAKTKVKDYVKTNTDLKYFVTYTLSEAVVGDRYDEKIIYKKLRSWLMNSVARKGLKYVLVPEQHKDGAWHFHGFTNLDLEWKLGYYATFPVRDNLLENTDSAIQVHNSSVGKNEKFSGCVTSTLTLKRPTKTTKTWVFTKEVSCAKKLKMS